MELTLEELKEKLANQVDEVTMVELLNITTEDLVERFTDIIENNYTKFASVIEEDYIGD